MIFKLLLLTAVAVCSVQGKPNRIVGGEPTTIDQYPSVVQVEFRSGIFWSQSCAANILTSRYVVTAAHCLDGLLFNINNRRIRAGATNRNSGGVVVNVIKRVNHPSYGKNGYDGDISVVEMSTPLTFSNDIQPVAIFSQGSNVPDNSPVVHAGWGATSQGGSASPVLRDVTIYTVNHNTCDERYGRRVTENMICAGILDVGGKDACQGDSGGPLYYGGILAGVVSWGQGCADANFPGVSTKVSSYTDWIVLMAV